ncbi:MAG: hypothetical protein AAGJ40_09125 [Planctomycetota bacterium]
MKAILAIPFWSLLGLFNLASGDLILYPADSVTQMTSDTEAGSSLSSTLLVQLPNFSPVDGEIETVFFRQQHVLRTIASSTATGGQPIPEYIGHSSWNVTSSYAISGLGVDASATENLRQFQPYTNDSPNQQASVLVEQIVADTGFLAFEAPDGFLGGLTIPIQVSFGHTTELFPFGVMPGGFRWDPFTTIDTGTIRQELTSTFQVAYDYTPTSVAIPELSSFAYVFGTALVGTGMVRRRRRIAS